MPVFLRRSAYSILEVMAAIVIVAVLAGVSLPTYKKFIIRSKIAESTSVAKRYQTMVADYYLENQSFPEAADLGIGTGETVTDSSHFPRDVNTMRFSKNRNGCACSDLIYNWDVAALGVTGKMEMWIRYENDDDRITASCGLHPDVFTDGNDTFFPKECRKNADYYGG